MTSIADKFGIAEAPTFGDQVASADAVSSTASADLISAAANTTGVRITGVSMTCVETTNATNSTLEFKINSVRQARVVARGDGSSIDADSVAFAPNMKVPAGQAVSYTFTEGATGLAWISVTYEVL